MPAAFHGDQQTAFAGKRDDILDIGDTTRLHDERRVLVDRLVEDFACLFVGFAAGEIDVTPQAVTQFL